MCRPLLSPRRSQLSGHPFLAQWALGRGKWEPLWSADARRKRAVSATCFSLGLISHNDDGRHSCRESRDGCLSTQRIATGETRLSTPHHGSSLSPSPMSPNLSSVWREGGKEERKVRGREKEKGKGYILEAIILMHLLL